MAEKRYQVFVSSTYVDLKDERLLIQRALLTMGCIPSGMELFPADDAEAWDVIKRVIDDCDYYVLIVAGRYGSLDASGISYTQKEYEYAYDIGRPVAAFFHDDLDSIVFGKSEKDADLRQRLDRFKELVRSRHHVRPWSDPGRLAADVVIGVVNLIATKPGVGWVRGSDAVSIEDVAELRGTVIRQEREIERLSREAVLVSEYAAGSDPHDLLIRVRYRPMGEIEIRDGLTKVHSTWDDMFGAIGPLMVGDAAEDKLRAALGRALVKTTDTITVMSAIAEEESFGTIKVQFMALGLMQLGVRDHGVKDTETWWSLTEAGRDHLVRIRAIKKSAEAADIGAAEGLAARAESALPDRPGRARRRAATATSKTSVPPAPHRADS